MSEPRDPHIVNVGEVEETETTFGARYAATRRALGRAAGGSLLGCSLYEVPPGRSAWPRHAHLANEEALFILEGEGTLTLGDKAHPIRAGDYVALPIGVAHAHLLENTSKNTLQYLCISTMREPDVSLYPDTGKIGVFAGAAPGGDAAERTFDRFLDASATVDYWDGED